MTKAISTLAILALAMYGTQLANAIQCDPAEYAAVNGTAATDEWCQTNCNHNPRFCPGGFCQCAEGATLVDPSDQFFDQLPAENCTSNEYVTVGDFQTDFCNVTCNREAESRSCPADFCECAGEATPSPEPSALPSPSPLPSFEPTPEPSLAPSPSPLPSLAPSVAPPPPDNNDTSGGAGDDVVIPEECFDFLPAAKADVDQIICEPGVYVAAQNYSDIPGMDLFCTQNCRLALNRFCPQTHCACGADAEERIQQPSRLQQLSFENRTCVQYGSLAPEVASDRFCDRTCNVNPELCFDALCECLQFEDEQPPSNGQNCTMQLVCEDNTDTDAGDDTEDLPARLRRLFNLRG